MKLGEFAMAPRPAGFGSLIGIQSVAFFGPQSCHDLVHRGQAIPVVVVEGGALPNQRTAMDDEGRHRGVGFELHGAGIGALTPRGTMWPAFSLLGR